MTLLPYFLLGTPSLMPKRKIDLSMMDIRTDNPKKRDPKKIKRRKMQKASRKRNRK